MPICTPRAARTAHWRACDPDWVWICGIASTFGPACEDTHSTSSIVQPLLHVRSLPKVCGQPSAEPKFHSRAWVRST